MAYDDTSTWVTQMRQVLRAEPSACLPAVLWNGGFYLWHTGLCDDLNAGIETTKALLTQGQVAATLSALQQQTT